MLFFFRSSHLFFICRLNERNRMVHCHGCPDILGRSFFVVHVFSSCLSILADLGGSSDSARFDRSPVLRQGGSCRRGSLMPCIAAGPRCRAICLRGYCPGMDSDFQRPACCISTTETPAAAKPGSPSRQRSPARHSGASPGDLRQRPYPGGCPCTPLTSRPQPPISPTFFRLRPFFC